MLSMLNDMGGDDYPIPEWDPTEFVYVQVADHLAGRIERGEIVVRVPPEAELAETYGVARMTVRRAVEELRERGMVRTLHGRGTFVVKRTEEQSDG